VQIENYVGHQYAAFVLRQNGGEERHEAHIENHVADAGIRFQHGYQYHQQPEEEHRVLSEPYGERDQVYKEVDVKEENEKVLDGLKLVEKDSVGE